MLNGLCSVSVAAVALCVTAVHGDILWDTGAHETVLFNGDETNLGWTSGFASDAQPQRYTPQPFTLGAGDFTLNSVLPSAGSTGAFFVPGADPTDIGWIIWSRNGSDAPTAADEIATGTSAYSGTETDPIDLGGVNLSGGDYYLTIYGIGATIGWFTNAPNAIAFADGAGDPWMYRSEMYPDPGFLVYQLDPSVLDAVPGTSNSHLYATEFVLDGTAVPGPAALALLGLAGLARRRRR